MFSVWETMSSSTWGLPARAAASFCAAAAAWAASGGGGGGGGGSSSARAAAAAALASVAVFLSAGRVRRIAYLLYHTLGRDMRSVVVVA